MEKQQTYRLKIYNGRIKIYIDGYVMLSFNQLDLLGYYSFKDDTSRYGIEFYFLRENAGASSMPVYFKTKDTWMAILRLIDENM